MTTSSTHRGSEITKCYVSTFLTTQQRQEVLMQGWYFR